MNKKELAYVFENQAVMFLDYDNWPDDDRDTVVAILSDYSSIDDNGDYVLIYMLSLRTRLEMFTRLQHSGYILRGCTE